MPSFLAELISRYQAMALRYLEGRTGDAETARDLYQGAVQAILQSGKAFSSVEHLRNYFFVALRNAATDLVRTKRRAREVQLPDDPSLLEDPKASNPESRLMAEEEIARERRHAKVLHAAIQRLPAAEKDLLRQRFWERKTFREIQESTGTAISTLKSREDAILRRLRKAVGEDS